MAQHATDTANTTKKAVAAAGFVLSVAGFGLFAGSGLAAADGHTVVNPDGTFGAEDVNNAYGTDWKPAVQSYVTSSYPAESSGSGGSNAPQVLYSVGHSYPASPSWPDNNWGAGDE